MKKLLSILGTVSLTATSTTTLISCEKPNKNENGGSNKPEPTQKPKKPQAINKNLNEFKIKNINGKISTVAVDSKNNIYIGTNKGAYRLFVESDTQTKIDGINGNVESITIDSKDNIYFGVKHCAYILKQGENKAIKLEGFSDEIGYFVNIVIDSKDNVYFASNFNSVYVLKKNTNIVIKINEINETITNIVIDSKDNVYFASEGLNGKIFFIKSGENTATTKFDFHITIDYMAVDSKDNLYVSFGGYFRNKKNEIKKSNSVFFYNSKNNTGYEINEINERIFKIIIDNNDDIYFHGLYDFYVLKHNKSKLEKIDGISGYLTTYIILNKDNNIYFIDKTGIYIYKLINKTKTKINEIIIDGYDIDDFMILKNNNIYVLTHDFIYILRNKI